MRVFGEWHGDESEQEQDYYDLQEAKREAQADYYESKYRLGDEE
jgi:hypothetical protein